MVLFFVQYLLQTIYFLNLLNNQITNTTTAITINIPKPIPALNISPIASHPVRRERSIANAPNLIILFCIIFCFLVNYTIKVKLCRESFIKNKLIG